MTDSHNAPVTRRVPPTTPTLHDPVGLLNWSLDQGLSMTKLAELTGVTRQTLYQVLGGHTPRSSTLKKISDARKAIQVTLDQKNVRERTLVRAKEVVELFVSQDLTLTEIAALAKCGEGPLGSLLNPGSGRQPNTTILARIVTLGDDPNKAIAIVKIRRIPLPERQKLALRRLHYMVGQELTRAEIRDLTGLSYFTVRAFLENAELPGAKACELILIHTPADIRIWQAEELQASQAERMQRENAAAVADRKLALDRAEAFRRLSRWRTEFTDAEIATLTGLSLHTLRRLTGRPAVKITRNTIERIKGVTSQDISDFLDNRRRAETPDTGTTKLYAQVEDLVAAAKQAKLGYKGIHEATGLAPTTIRKLLKGVPLDTLEEETLFKVLALKEALAKIPDPAANPAQTEGGIEDE